MDKFSESLSHNQREYSELANRITDFINMYAGISPNYDPNDSDNDDDKYTCPDTYVLLHAAKYLNLGLIPVSCFSDWGSGGYKPYSSKEGRKEHDEIVKEISKLMK